MTPILISVSIFKYGQFRETIQQPFNNMSEFQEYLAEKQDYKDYLFTQEEPYVKWVEKFTFEGIDYSFPIDC